MPRAHQLLWCSPDTSWAQLEALLTRCRFIPGVYCILHVERLSYATQHRLVERIISGELRTSYRLVLLALCDDASRVHTLRAPWWHRALGGHGARRSLLSPPTGSPRLGCSRWYGTWHAT